MRTDWAWCYENPHEAADEISSLTLAFGALGLENTELQNEIDRLQDVAQEQKHAADAYALEATELRRELAEERKANTYIKNAETACATELLSYARELAEARETIAVAGKYLTKRNYTLAHRRLDAFLAATKEGKR